MVWTHAQAHGVRGFQMGGEDRDGSQTCRRQLRCVRVNRSNDRSSRRPGPSLVLAAPVWPFVRTCVSVRKRVRVSMRVRECKCVRVHIFAYARMPCGCIHVHVWARSHEESVWP
eukprot:6205338-Pleurochrysis_carterae.AAC.1